MYNDKWLKNSAINAHIFCTISVRMLHDLHFFGKKSVLYANGKTVREKFAFCAYLKYCHIVTYRTRGA